jgi:hypothetical protein
VAGLDGYGYYRYSSPAYSGYPAPSYYGYSAPSYYGYSAPYYGYSAPSYYGYYRRPFFGFLLALGGGRLTDVPDRRSAPVSFESSCRA